MTKATVTKRIVAILATMMLFVGMVVPAIAAPSQPNTGQITVHKYERNTAGAAHPDNMHSGERLTGLQEAALGEPLDGVGFTLYEMNMAPVEAYLSANPGVDITGYTVAGLVVTYTFSMGEPPMTVTATPFAEGNEQFTGALVPGSGEIVFGNNDLDDGYYLLVETTPLNADYIAAEPAVIKTPLTLNDGSGENRDIHVYPKNVDTTAPVVEKTFGGVPAPINNGDIVPFKITTAFRNNEAAPADKVASVADLFDGVNYGTVSVSDTLAAYFSYVDPLTVPVGTKEVDVYFINGGGQQIGASLTEGVEYALAGVTPGLIGPGAPIVVTLTNQGIDEAILANAAGLAVEFDAVYTGGASNNPGVTTVTNTATVIVQSPTGMVPPVIPPAVFNLPTASIIVDKETDVAGVKLAGAVFTLTTGPGVTIIYDHTGGTMYTPAEMTIIENEYVIDVNTGFPLIGTSNALGEVFFNNVPYTDAGVTYYLRELETAAGYELPAGHIEVELEAKGHILNAGQLDINGDWIDGATINRTVTVSNNPLGTNRSFSLPLTGGAGTALFTIAGIVLMAGAVAIYLRGKKKNA